MVLLPKNRDGKLLKATFAFLVLLVLLASCHEPFEPHIRELIIDESTQTLSLSSLSTGDIVVTVDVPSRIKEITVSWTTDSPNVAVVDYIDYNAITEEDYNTISGSGSATIYVEGIANFNLVVNAKKKGNATITITVQPGGLTAVCEVAVDGGGPPEVIFSKNTTDASATEAVPQSVTFTPGQTISLPTTNPTRTHYNFMSWNTMANGSGTQFTASTTVTNGITVYAQWTGKTYTVTFDKNDGTSPPASTIETKNVTYPASTATNPTANVTTHGGGMPTAPTRTNFRFKNWSTNSAGGTSFTGTTAVTGDITVFAQWGITVTFDKNHSDATGFTEANPKERNIDISANLATLPAPPTRDGHTFKEWNTKDDGTGDKVEPTSQFIQNTTVYAIWTTADTYTVTFDKNGGDTDATPTTKTVTAPATTVGTLPTAPTWAGHTFESWNTKDDGTGTLFEGTTTVSANITVYAQWTSDSPSFKLNTAWDDSHTEFITASSPVSLGDEISLTATITGYTFDSWYIDGVKDSATTLTSPFKYTFFTTGTHSITLVVIKGSVYYSSEIKITVTN
jgi:uncharacterized repeat protein (TIGR02543 family)